MALTAGRSCAAVPALGADRHRPGAAAGLDDGGHGPRGAARSLLHDRRDRGHAGVALPGLLSPVAIHTAPGVPTRVAGARARRPRPLHYRRPLVRRDLRIHWVLLLRREASRVLRVTRLSCPDTRE